MRILILDDDPTRRREYTERFNRWNQEEGFYCEVEFASDRSTCMSFLHMMAYYSAIFLDHDLSGRQMVSPLEEDTGSEIVRWLVEKPYNENLNKAFFVLHTYNEEGAEYMRNLLLEHTNRVIVAPGAWLEGPFRDVMKEILERS